ncbi:peptide chain release factor 2 [Bdellovibrio svalbardensis]|uniref:Peptide chain release factor 2 n=1 Tax=Bdellovibrio svalbardensis TaxID=2972972 RepID=A0ABT6DL01_9BACT|nr:peptide chain release factor 2 [Bdellovibrio svalbardensis]MDG0817544.1 peptide chain release factor 2 [Bdellovibrio svalbardensis]
MSIVTEASEVKSKILALESFSKELRGYFDLDKKKKRLDELAIQAENPALWEKPAEMQKLNKEKSLLEKAVGEFEGFLNRMNDAKVLLEMAEEAQDEDSFTEVKTEVAALEKFGQELELKRVLNGELDSNSTYLSINSGAGGTESCDWAEMLLRMYMRYADKHGYKYQMIDVTEGEGAGIKSCTLLIEGPYAYGYLKAESGVHRLVRISPFDSSARRHTSFASVFAWAEVDDDINIEVKPDEIRVETFRSSGAGGQHVNKTDSAVRMYHLPTGIVVSCQIERSQIQNREKAMKMLKAKLYEKEIEKRNAEKDAMNSVKKANEWGSQIRSYVMHPYQLVKDHRTDFETNQVDDVMNGDLDDFIMSYLKSQITAETPAL